jgi:hypothetical protein
MFQTEVVEKIEVNVFMVSNSFPEIVLLVI